MFYFWKYVSVALVFTEQLFWFMVNPMGLMKHQYDCIQHNKQITYIFQNENKTLMQILIPFRENKIQTFSQHGVPRHYNPSFGVVQDEGLYCP